VITLSKIFRREERSINVVPKSIFLVLIIFMSMQICWHWNRPTPIAMASKLSDPPSKVVFDLVSFGEPVVLAKLLMLWLQAFDNQPGISIPFKDLDYARVIKWLQRILELDSKIQYPLLSASRLYGAVPDDAKKRKMMDFVYEKFLEMPNDRWMWLAHSVSMAKHKLNDLELALKYARAIRTHAIADHVPTWARQMELFVLEDLGDIEGAKILLGGLIESGVIKDRHELQFLKGRLGLQDH